MGESGRVIPVTMPIDFSVPLSKWPKGHFDARHPKLQWLARAGYGKRYKVAHIDSEREGDFLSGEGFTERTSFFMKQKEAQAKVALICWFRQICFRKSQVLMSGTAF